MKKVKNIERCFSSDDVVQCSGCVADNRERKGHREGRRELQERLKNRQGENQSKINKIRGAVRGQLLNFTLLIAYRHAAPMIPASLPSVAATIFVCLSLCFVILSCSTIALTGARRFSP